MERLTQWIDNGEQRNAIPRMDLRRNGHEKCTTRLAKYEDTGLTPEQVQEMAEVVNHTNEIFGDCITVPEIVSFFTEFYEARGKRVSNAEGGNFCQNCGQRLLWEEKQ